MTLSSGGIYSTLSGNGANVVQNGQLTTSANEWVITNALGGLTISANLGETTAGTALTKTGAGTLTLSGTNTYSGVTTLQQGVLVATSDASLGTGSSVAFAGGSLQAGGNVSSAKSMTAIGTAGVLIDTSTFNVSLSGSITGILTKTGAGTLALTQAPSRFAYVNAGWLSFLNGTSGTFVLEGGNLLASGSIDYLDVDNTTGTLDVGGAAAANLTIGTVTNPYSNFTIDFGLGSAAADHLSVTHGFDLPIGFEGSFQFEFQNLGGLMTGVDYSLIDFGPGVTAPDSGVFQLAPDLVSDGWSATFTSNANGVSVNFSAIPEPGSGALLITAGIALAIRRRRPTSR
jgi:autotransporter-associated beta strand protein